MPAFCAVIASFSYEISTSPLPPANVCSASRADLSWTAVLASTLWRKSVASAGDLPWAICEPYAAIRFHLAPPEVNGFGVMTSTPGLTMSSQDLIPFGLPLRTASTTTELVTKPSVEASCDVQLEATIPGSTSLSTSGASERATMSAGRPAATARDWSPDAP